MVRTHPRTIDHTPIKVAPSPSGAYAPSRARDFSSAGLCWETDQAALTERPVFILTAGDRPGTCSLNAYRSYVAVVKWCRPAENAASGRLLAGARIISMSHGLFEDLQQLCDLCGAVYPQAHFERSPDWGSLCGACARHFEGLNEAVQASIRHFASGRPVAREDERFR